MWRDPARVFPLESEERDFGAALFGNAAHQRIGGVRDQEPIFGQQRDEVLERLQVRGERWIDVDMIVLDGRDDRDLGSIVEKLRRLFEERGVVLVTLDDERAPSSSRLWCRQPARPRRAKAPRETARQTSHQKTRAEPGTIQEMRGHRSGRRFAVRSSDDERRRIVQDEARERPRNVRIR